MSVLSVIKERKGVIVLSGLFIGIHLGWLQLQKAPEINRGQQPAELPTTVIAHKLATKAREALHITDSAPAEKVETGNQ